MISGEDSPKFALNKSGKSKGEQKSSVEVCCAFTPQTLPQIKANISFRIMFYYLSGQR